VDACITNKAEPAVPALDDIIEIFKRLRLSFSLGDSLRPGASTMLSDAAQVC